MTAISAAESCSGAAKKLRLKTSKARCRAVAGKPVTSSSSRALRCPMRSCTPGTSTSRSWSTAGRFTPASSVRGKLGLVAARANAFSGGMEGSPENRSLAPELCTSG